MRSAQFVFLAFLFRIFILIAQRTIGMEWNFHIDATFYVDRIMDMRNTGWYESIIIAGFENFLFILLGYLLYLLGFGFFQPENILISFNIFISLATMCVLIKLFSDEENKKIPIVLVFFAFSPYFSHLSVHPLKDVFVIFLSVSFLYSLIKNKWFLALLIGFSLVSARLYLGFITIAVLTAWRYSLSFEFKRMQQLLLLVAGMAILFFGANDQLSERLDVEFEGRDFYPNGLALVPENIYFRYFLGGLFNFLVPFPFIPSRPADLGYFIHISFLIFLIFNAIRQNLGKKIKINSASFGLMLCSFFIFSFVLTTTPGAGPLVRYRLFSEILLLIAFGNINFLKSTRDNNFIRSLRVKK